MAPLSASARSRRATLPSPKSTHSYWHRAPSELLLGHRTTPTLPATADIVVIGSGISGAFAARELVAGGRAVVMLEAREACWGATGRNGGHCQPGVWNSAEEIARFELATFDMLRDLVATHHDDIQCDWRVVGGVHAIYEPELLRAAEAQIRRLQEDAPDLKDLAALVTDPEELKRLRVEGGALGAVVQTKAAKLWPYRLVAWVLEQLLLLRGNDEGVFNLQTTTPVTRLERGEGKWTVHTSRGEISAREVLLTANAYTSYLLPGLTDVIVPVRGQVCALEPPAGATQLPHSYVWVGAHGDQYLVHRGPEDTQVEEGKIDRSLVLGGERLADPAGEEGISADDATNPVIGAALRRALAVGGIKLRPDGGPEKDVLEARYEWTGIMGYSRDGHPWVGQVPAKFFLDDDGSNAGSDDKGEEEGEELLDGLWMSAGFTGHGMPVAPRCGVAVAEMILGKKTGAVEIPAAWVASGNRAARARVLELPRSFDELVRLLPLSRRERAGK